MQPRMQHIEAINADLGYHRRQCARMRANLSFAIGLDRLTFRARLEEHQRAVARLEQQKRNFYYHEHGFDSMGFSK